MQKRASAEKTNCAEAIRASFELPRARVKSLRALKSEALCTRGSKDLQNSSRLPRWDGAALTQRALLPATQHWSQELFELRMQSSSRTQKA